MRSALRRTAAFAAILAVLGGCMKQRAETVAVDSAPAALPVATISPFRQALGCLDGLMAEAHLTTTEVVVGSMPDLTGSLSVGMREMTMNAIGKANVRSGAFRVIDLPVGNQAEGRASGSPTNIGVDKIYGLAPTSLHVSGSIMALNRSATGTSLQAGVSDANNSGGLAFVSDIGTVTTGMRVSRFQTREQLYNEQHQISIHREDLGGSLFGTIGGVTPFLEISFARNDSPSAAVQTLVDLHVLELLGRASGVPYWTCLSGAAADPESGRRAGALWRELDQPEREARVARALAQLGYRGPDAVVRYQIDRGLFASGRVGFETFLSAHREAPALIEAAAGQGAPVPGAPAPNRLTLKVTELMSGKRLELGLSRGGHGACFHRDADGALSRIFPNPYQPNAYLTASATHFVPNTIAEKAIALTGSNLEFMCVVTPTPQEERLAAIYRIPAFRDLGAAGLRSFAGVQAAYARVWGDEARFVRERSR